MTFGKPTIGPRAYLASGPSAWLETFDRKAADEALRRFLRDVPLELAVESFVRAQKKQLVLWSMIVAHLAGLARVTEDAIEPAVGVAFWAAIELTTKQAKTN